MFALLGFETLNNSLTTAQKRMFQQWVTINKDIVKRQGGNP